MTFDYGALALIAVQAFALVYFAGRLTQKVETIESRVDKCEEKQDGINDLVIQLATRKGIDL